MSGLIHSLRTLFGSPNTSADVDNTNNRRSGAGGSSGGGRSRITRSQRARKRSRSAVGDDEENGDNHRVSRAYGEENSQKNNDDEEEEEDEDDDGNNVSLRTQATTPATPAGGAANAHANERIETADNDTMEDQNNGPLSPSLQSSSPLTDFFAHVTANGNKEGGHHHTLNLATLSNERSRQSSMSLKEWKEARKSILREYLTHRLIRSEEEDPTGRSNNDDYYDGDDCSFSSNVLDEPFSWKDNESKANTAMDDTTNNNDQAGESESESEDDDATVQLETQPQSAIGSAMSKGSAASSNFGQVVENDEYHFPYGTQASPLKTQQQEGEESMSNLEEPDTQEEEEELTPGSRRREGIFSGIKRKLGFANQPEEEEGEEATKKKCGEEESLPPKKRSRTQSRPSKLRHSGLMWDGHYQSVIHVEDTFSSPCSKLAALDLSSRTLNLSLCRVLRVWDIRMTKRMDKRMSMRDYEGTNNSNVAMDTPEEELHPHRAMMPFEFREDDGPLNTIYKRVFSMDIAQLIDDEEDTLRGRPETISPSIANMATAAFFEGRHHLDKETSRKRRHAVRRVRVFFYNNYADAMSTAFHDLRQPQPTGKKRKQPAVPLFLLSLAKVPAECILPLSIASSRGDPRLRQYVQNPYGDEEFGSLSPYCVCIGDKSSIKFGGGENGDRHALYFDCDDLEIRLVKAPGATANRPSADPLADDNVGNDGNDFVLNKDAVITAASIRDRDGHGYVMEGEESDLVKRYVQSRERASSAALEEPIIFNPEEEEEMDSATNIVNNAVPNNAGIAGLGNTSTTTEANNNGENNADSHAASRTSAGETTETDGIVRPRSIVPLCNLSPILLQHNAKRLKDPITVYGVVLGFSPPSLTRTEQWVMSIVLIDDTLPLTNQAQGRSNTVGDAGGDDNNKSNPKDLHVPSVTLVLFAKDKSKLPVVKSAGDVICCEKVVLQEWSGEPQLCARKTSNVVIVRPVRPRRPGDGDELHDSTSPNDYSASCSCHDSNDETTHNTLHWPLANSLWRWGQRRLSEHPTMSPNCYLSIAEIVGDHHNRQNNNNNNENNFEVSVSGDLTAAVTAIIPVPEQLRRRDTPRGYIRLWDGTGPSRTDPLPPYAAGGNLNQQPRDDPPEQVLVTIEKILRDISSSPSSGRDADVIQAPIALCGRVINATIWEENLWNLIYRENMVDVGSFVRLRNVNNAKLPTTGTNCISVHIKSSLTPLPFDAYEIKGLLKGHATRIQRGVPPNPTSAILPATRSSSRPDVAVRRGVSPNPTSAILPATSRPDVAAQEMRNSGLSIIEECLQKPAPATFTIQFEVSHTLPACNPTSIDAIKALYTKKKDGTSSFRFALHIKDASSEVDVLCLGRVAEELLGITTQDVISGKSEKCQGALGTLKELMSPGSICEGKIRSILGKDGKLYFILKSMFCITTETV